MIDRTQPERQRRYRAKLKETVAAAPALQARCAELEARIVELESKRAKRRPADLKGEHLRQLDRWCVDRGRPVPADNEERVNALVACAIEALEEFAKAGKSGLAK